MIASGPTLLEAVSHFDRRERQAVLRMLGGESAGTINPTAAGVLADAVGANPSAFVGAPWFMDYTWNWLVAAVTIFDAGRWESGKPLPNAEGLVEPNQEDVDALVVAGDRLVLLEMKWEAAWGTGQIERKSKRLRAFGAYVGTLPRRRPAVDVVLVSPDGRGLDDAAERFARLSGMPVRPLASQRLLANPATTTLEVPYTAKLAPWSMQVSRAWSSGTAA